MKLYKREKYLKKIRGFYDATDIIKVITGVRRCGKSSLMLTIADELIDKGVSKDNIVYIDLDKRGYRSIKSADQLDALIEEKTMNINGTKYLFIGHLKGSINHIILHHKKQKPIAHHPTWLKQPC